MRARIALGMALLAGAAGLVASCADMEPANSAARQAVAGKTSRALADILADLATRRGHDDLNFLADGVWHGNDRGYWFCNVGAGTAAAVLWHTGGEKVPHLRDMAVRTFDTAIAAHHNANGSFGRPPDGDDIETTSFGVQLGTAYLQLADSLSVAERSRWQSALAGAADFLVRNGNLVWYTNGNVNLSQVELFYLAWRATGEARFKDDFEQAWEFALNPPQDRWPGFGLHITGASFPAQLRSDPALSGYLAESAGEPGFDADYTVLQLDAAAGIYLFSGDQRARDLASLLANTLVDRTNRRSLLNTSNGTRHPQPGRSMPLLTSGLAILAGTASRRRRVAPLQNQLHMVISTYRSALGYGYSPYLYRGLGTQLSMILLAQSARS